MSGSPRFRVGCSGWQYRHWQGNFYPRELPQARWFEHYASIFDTVEINNSFYRLPEASTLTGWKDRAPAGFLYAVKASRYLTHMKKLKEPEEPISRFFERASRLGGKLGPVLYQLPPRWPRNLERFEEFLAALPRRRRHAVEFREASWYAPETYRALERAGVALCLHDMGGSESPPSFVGPFAYVRFHGSGRKYGGRYPDGVLEEWAERLSEQVRLGREVYAYFNNDSGGHAPRDAIRLRDAVGRLLDAGSTPRLKSPDVNRAPRSRGVQFRWRKGGVMRKFSLVVLVGLFCLAASAGAQTFVGVMNGANEAPSPGDPDGFGLAGFRFEGSSLVYEMQIQNIGAPNASHIHRGAPGVAGPVLINLASAFPNNSGSGIVSVNPALVAEIQSNPGNFYVNVHNTDFPGGAIRAQLSNGAFAILTGGAVEPGPGDPDGTGMAVFTVSGTTLTFNAIVQDIGAPNASHIHSPAIPSRPVVVPTASSFPDNRATGTATISPALLEEFLTLGSPFRWYFDVHNAEYPGGAIRGQLSFAPFNEVAYFPVVGRVDGLNNTRFVSDVRIVNTATSPATVILEYFAAGTNQLWAIARITVAPGAEAVIDDVVASQFDSGGLGAMKVTASGAVTTGVRVFNDLRPIDGGTTGFFIAPKEISDAQTSGVLPFLSNASPADTQARLGFRTNIGWFNPNQLPAGVTFRAHRASDGAVLGSVDVGVAEFSQLQQGVFQLISTVAEADRTQTDFYVTWTSTIPIFVYAAVVDNRTGDVVYVD